MKKLCDRIVEEGVVRNATILDVSSFFNAQIDSQLMVEIGQDFAQAFAALDYDLIVTVESSGIAPALCASIASQKPLVVIKKEMREKEALCTVPCYSYTKDATFFLSVRKDFLKDKRVILIDDFLADGNVLNATTTLLTKAEADLKGVGVCIAKTFQKGYDKASKSEFTFHCQAKVTSLKPLKVA